jgi:hypothetical protein
MKTQHGSGKPQHTTEDAHVSAVTQETPVETAETAENPDEARRGGAPTRPYVVLEEIQLDTESSDGEVAYQKVAVVEARNGTNALRKAFKELRQERGDVFGEAILSVIPEGQWKPTPVRAERKESITVAVGE